MIEAWIAAPLCVMCVLGGLAIGLWYGETGKVAMLQNMLTHGTPRAAPQGRTIHPETAERRLEADAKLIEREYTKATIGQGVDHLKALYVSEGVHVPSDKDLEVEVKEMLGRSGTPEAGVG